MISNVFLTASTSRARTPSPSGDDWVLVGASSPAPGDLGALEPLRPGTDSSPPSSAASDVGEEAEPQPGVVTRYGDVRPRVVDRYSNLRVLVIPPGKSCSLTQYSV